MQFPKESKARSQERPPDTLPYKQIRAEDTFKLPELKSFKHCDDCPLKATVAKMYYIITTGIAEQLPE